MYRTYTCGELCIADLGKTVTLAGWVQRIRKMGGMTFIDLRDRYGITQLVFNQEINAELCEQANKLGREFVLQVTGEVAERSAKNKHIPTGDIEIIVSELTVLNEALTPPFTIEDETDGGDDLRMKYRYLDLRRACVQNLELRHKMTIEVRRYLDEQGFGSGNARFGQFYARRCAILWYQAVWIKDSLCSATKSANFETIAYGFGI